VPARSWDRGDLIKHDVVCLFVADPVDGGAKGCYTAEEVKAGAATGSLGTTVYGLVLDGVAEVHFLYPSGTETAMVRDNFYEQPAPHRQTGGATTPLWAEASSWSDADRNPTPDQPATP
jgi:hypothetical protein